MSNSSTLTNDIQNENFQTSLNGSGVDQENPEIHGIQGIQESLDVVGTIEITPPPVIDPSTTIPKSTPLPSSSSSSSTYTSFTPSSQMDYRPTRAPKIWAIGGGKGGVGKSLVTANMAICLALMGHKVITIDLDLGGANLHTCLGVPIPEVTLSDYLTKKVSNVEDLLTKTPIPNLSLISGAQDDLGIANLKAMHKSKLLSKLNSLDANYILFDLGAGTASNTLDFFISSDQGILTVLPEPTSIENTYRFIRSVYYHRLKMVEDFLEIRPLIDQVLNAKLSGPKNIPVDLIQTVINIDPERGMRLKNEISKFKPKLIMNQVRTQADIDIGFSIKAICKRYFGIELDYVGYLDYDAVVWQSIKKRRPLLMEFPSSKLVTNFDHIVHRLLNSN